MTLPYKPKRLPPKIDVNALQDLLFRAHEVIARFDEAVLQLPEPKILQYTLQTNEAVLSSKIEGTQITLQQLFLIETLPQNVSKENYLIQDYQEVVNYRSAIDYGYEYIKKHKKITLSLVKKLHQILLDSVRGKDKHPGEYRKLQVFIGKPGVSIDQASFIPCSPQEVPLYMRELIRFIQIRNELSPILKAGIIHFQFEAIHPFEDGNGRIGRLLIPLYLFAQNVTHYPNIYVSEFFETYRQEYYNALQSVSQTGKWENWLDFYLNAIVEQTKASYRKVQDIRDLYNKFKEWGRNQKSYYLMSAIDVLFTNPVITPSLLRKKLHIRSRQTVYNIIQKLAKEKYILSKTQLSKNFMSALNNSSIGNVYIFKPLFDIIEKRYRYVK